MFKQKDTICMEESKIKQKQINKLLNLRRYLIPNASTLFQKLDGFELKTLKSFDVAIYFNNVNKEICRLITFYLRQSH